MSSEPSDDSADDPTALLERALQGDIDVDELDDDVRENLDELLDRFDVDPDDPDDDDDEDRNDPDEDGVDDDDPDDDDEDADEDSDDFDPSDAPDR